MHFVTTTILSTVIENRGHLPWPSRSFRPFWHRILGNLACLCNNPIQIWAEITKFAPNMHNGILFSGIENSGLWSWPSRSFWPFRQRILGNLACSHNNLKLIWARITKFAPNMHLELLLTGIEYRGYWPWPSRSFGHFESGYSVLPIYPGGVYGGIGYIAVACLTPFFWRPRARHFLRNRGNSLDPICRRQFFAKSAHRDSLYSWFAGDNFSRNQLNAGWNTCCARVSHARQSIDTSIMS